MCVYMRVSLCMYLASQLSFVRCTESVSPLTKFCLFVGFFIFDAQSKKMQPSTQLLFPKSPLRQVTPSTRLYFCPQFDKQNFPYDSGRRLRSRPALKLC